MMNLTLQNLKKALPEFNLKPYTETDFWRICEQFNIEVLPRKMDNNGYYVTDRAGEFIFISQDIKNHYLWLLVAYHELVHAICHYPCKFLYNKHELQAETLSIIAICPLWMLYDREIQQQANFDVFLRIILTKRRKIREIYGI